MKTISLFLTMALLGAMPAAAQGIYDARDQSAAAAKHATARGHTSRVRGEGAYASGGAARAFDGPWSVLIETRAGACEPSFRYGVEIQNGEVLNAGGAPVSLAGHVTPSGAVSVIVAAGGQEAHGAGRLTRSSGSGTWRGAGSAGTCAGVWVAERRG